MKKYFLVDYENVKSEGLNGITSLTENDNVKIFYSKDAQTLTFGLHRRIMNAQANIDYIKIDNSIKSSLKNALDVILLSELNTLIKLEREAEFFIISKDSDFDNYIDDKTRKGIKICKIPDIRTRHQELPISSSDNNIQIYDKKKKEQVFRSFFGKKMKNNYEDWKEEIIEAYLESKSRQELNNRLQKTFTNEATRDILDTIKEFTKDMPGRIY